MRRSHERRTLRRHPGGCRHRRAQARRAALGRAAPARVAGAGGAGRPGGGAARRGHLLARRAVRAGGAAGAGDRARRPARLPGPSAALAGPGGTHPPALRAPSRDMRTSGRARAAGRCANPATPDPELRPGGSCAPCGLLRTLWSPAHRVVSRACPDVRERPLRARAGAATPGPVRGRGSGCRTAGAAPDRPLGPAHRAPGPHALRPHHPPRVAAAHRRADRSGTW